MTDLEQHNLLMDLNTLLEDSTPLDREIITKTETPEQSLNLDNINLLDEDKKEEKGNLRTPGAILDEYTLLDLDNQKIDIEIEQFKEKHLEIFEEYQAMLDKISINRSKQDSLKSELVESLQDAGLPNISNNRHKATFVAATVRHNFDTAKFKKKYPVLYNSFTTTSNVKADVKISEVNKK